MKFFNIRSLAKYQKSEWGTFGDKKKSKKTKTGNFEKSQTAGKSNGDFLTSILFQNIKKKLKGNLCRNLKILKTSLTV